MMMHLEHIPSAGQHFEWGGLRFEVLDMDLHRVDKVLIAPALTAPSLRVCHNGNGEAGDASSSSGLPPDSELRRHLHNPGRTIAKE